MGGLKRLMLSGSSPDWKIRSTKRPIFSTFDERARSWLTKNSESSQKGDDSPTSKGRSKAADKWQNNRSIFVDVLQFFLLMTFLFWVGWRGDAMEYRWQWYRVPNFSLSELITK